MKIVFLDARTLGDVPTIGQLDTLGETILHPDTQPEQVVERIQGAEVVITNKVKVTREAMTNAPELKLICVAATGMNNVDLTAANELGIQVKNVKGYSTDSVAQQTIALLLALLNSTAYYDDYVKTGEYSQERIFTHLGRPYWELSGKRFGILGLGEIGRQVARIALAFGAEVVYFSASGQEYNVIYERLELDEFLQTCDVISIHAPLSPDTENLLNYARIAQMKPTALLLNTSRGGIVNEADLAKALDDDLIAGAAIDVFTQEPIPASHPYLQLQKKEKLLLAPHIAWSSIEARTRLMEKVADNIRGYLAG
ncbi:D-2-hydroxyacid dehydrogenase [Runella slithyformis]|uniref:Phosphoglycerate dehydrogenase n=1 Tax=Runella slithyformis (strain ATCC 29530 / DSM 19594 / LMG 11500 / NCIMB 11436 / LSU 4) TaxID=761193 RepID=A0A7U3ZML5_RUNSL|nr:D-2-hydroxyacid dehydrogenase [Runella slithyformis]AEI49967.1 Phosphoglycerate dehydrogenase [Runella slithyformis DSM 19594]